ncbi:hypothetical protein G4B11_005503 [Aspergillus flavus]|nr:hypothetical protein G4B11_005503 [Aspergillus flavus]
MSARRHRSAVACQHCRQRKVRCSFTVTGVPCIGCTQDGTECIIPQGKAQTTYNELNVIRPRIRQVVPHIRQNGPENSPRIAEGSRRSMPPRPSASTDTFTIAPITPQIERPRSVGGTNDVNTSPEENRSLDEERTGAEIATAALGRNRRAGQAPFYTGESPGFGSVLDLCSPPQQPVQRHILLQPKRSIPLSAEDREYLQYKGVFNLPRSDTCDELLRAYFHHVHPIVPVVDATSVLSSYPNHGFTSLPIFGLVGFLNPRKAAAPLRIDLRDCDTVMPSSVDMLSDMTGLPEAVASAYIPTDLPRLADCWVTMIHLSKLLGDVLSLSYRPLGPHPSLQQVEATETEILLFQFPDNSDADRSRLATFYMYHLQLHYQALLITFYRPYITKVPEGLPVAQQQAWRSQIRNKMDAAALQTNSIVDNLAREKLLEFGGPMTPPLLVPAMQVHLLNCKSSDGFIRRLGLNKLELCMMILEQMQHTYPSASIFRGIFLGAIRQVFPDYMVQPSKPGTAAPEYPILQDAPLDDPAASMVIGDDVIGALMDEASTYNFWETFSWM